MEWELKYIQFGILSKREILEQSVCEVSNTKLTGSNSVYDERMGVLDNGKKCVTCNKTNKECLGHFGHIILNQNILHPMFYKSIISILKCVCYKCSKLLLTKAQLEFHNILKYHKQTRFLKILKYLEKIDFCIHCQTIQPRYHFSVTDKTIQIIFKIEGILQRNILYDYEIKKIFENITDDDVTLLGFDINHNHPKNFIIDVLPVLPPIARPYVISENVTCDDDLTIQYLEIIKANIHIKKELTNDIKCQRYINALKFRIKCLFDNSQERSKHSNGRPLKGIKKRLTGKEGQLRNNLMGKRVNKSARTVIGPDPTLKVNEIAIPYEIAEVLTYPVIINEHNISEMTSLLYENKINYIIKKNTGTRINVKYALYRQGDRLQYGDYILKKNGNYIFIKNEKQFFLLENEDVVIRNGIRLINFKHSEMRPFQLEIGDIVERKLRNGDVLLLNRQPTLHKGSMMAFNIILRDSKIIRTNLAITKSFNADFDGDEMNLHGVNNAETETELRLLSSVNNHIISPQSNKANIVIVQDGLLGSYLLSKYDLDIPKSVFFRILDSIKWCPKLLEKKQKIFQSESKNNISQFSGKMLFSMLLPDDFFLENKQICIRHGVLINGNITKSQLGNSHQSIIVLLYQEYSSDRCVEFINNVQFLAYAFLNWYGFSIGIKDCIIHQDIVQKINESNEKIFIETLLYEESIKNKQISELYVSKLLGNARDKGMKFAKDHLSESNGFLTTVTSGSKGDVFNITQIMGLLGQQNFQGQRIQPTLNNNKRTLPHYPIDLLESNNPRKYESQGFIQNSFLKGLNPYEFWFHSITGREGITDTAMKTATSGYIQRRMIKVAEDVQIKYDGTVRNSSGSILQFRYGYHLYDPIESVILKDDSMFFTNVDRLVNRLNHEYENKIY